LYHTAIASASAPDSLQKIQRQRDSDKRVIFNIVVLPTFTGSLPLLGIFVIHETLEVRVLETSAKLQVGGPRFAGEREISGSQIFE